MYIAEKDGKMFHCWQSSCYYFAHNDAVSITEAESACSALGGHVVALETQEEQEAVLGMVNKYGKIWHIGTVFHKLSHRTTNDSHNNINIKYLKGTLWLLAATGTLWPLAAAKSCIIY